MCPIIKITDDCLNSYLKEGLSQSEIARACDMSRQAVNQRIKYTPNTTPKKRLKKIKSLIQKGLTIDEISKELNHVHITTTHQIFSKLGLPTPTRFKRKLASIIFLASKGYNVAEIAQESGYTYASVYFLIKNYNIIVTKYKGVNMAKTVNVKVKVPKKTWDKFKIKAIINQKTNEQLLLEIIRKETDGNLSVLQQKRKKL